MASDNENPLSKRQKVQSAEVGTEILKALAELAPATSLSRLAEHVGMPASKVHRYLQALIASGFAEQDPATSHYGLGQAALFVGLAAIGRLDVIRIAAPRLAELRDELNETCFLAVWGNRGPAVVHVEQAARAVTLVTQVGSVLPLLGSSTGQVFQAFLPERETALLRQVELGETAAAQAEALAVQEAQIRASGLQHVHGLLMQGVNALSVPVFATGSRLAGVITVVGTAPGFQAEPEGPQARRLVQVAEAISARMGGQRPS
ncbi:IclR family transcriptional regulator [Azotobacter beijerinckii]|uniref:IclR family transcriptional regulator n=1 Tax=Azotobacter beijerinckii TaxID=170623 RepID=UPI0029547D00|nr:IclR family transcriptional regulator [Azotobacter beijerinckii]MDV7212899.1 IclR family transcriptional regulator [Azotobacter beijerinckii]